MDVCEIGIAKVNGITTKQDLFSRKTHKRWAKNRCLTRYRTVMITPIGFSLISWYPKPFMAPPLYVRNDF